jgi:tetratricopeptide (TPR) repeat protein
VIARIDNESLMLASAETRPKHLLVVGSDLRTFETRVDLDPVEPSVFPLASLPAGLEVFLLRDERGNILLDSRGEHGGTGSLPIPTIPSLEALGEASLRSAERIPSVAAAAAFARGLLAMRKSRWEEAVELFEEAAILRGDDPLTWWAKNWCLRHQDEANEHDLPNAHYLAPLDPVLRADAYLNAPEDAKPEPLLDTWGDDPQPFLEVADLLHDAGLVEARVRWLEEARRRAPCSLIEMLLAAAHLEQGRELAAAEHVAFAAAALDTVAASRRSEVDAVAQVRDRFPLG